MMEGQHLTKTIFFCVISIHWCGGDRYRNFYEACSIVFFWFFVLKFRLDGKVEVQKCDA